MSTTSVHARLHPGAFVEFARRQRRLSGRAIAKKAGLSSGYISKLEAGTIEPSLGNFARVACALDLSPLELWVVIRNAGCCPTPSLASTDEVFGEVE